MISVVTLDQMKTLIIEQLDLILLTFPRITTTRIYAVYETILISVSECMISRSKRACHYALCRHKNHILFIDFIRNRLKQNKMSPPRASVKFFQ